MFENKIKRDGRSGHPLFHTWENMRRRCYDKDNTQYKDYGGRGIYIAEEWKYDFWKFLTDMGERPEGRSLDRIDNDGPYRKDNCRWATSLEQNRNSRKYNHGVSVWYEKHPTKNYDRWRGKITRDGKRICNSFSTQEEAVAWIKKETSLNIFRIKPRETDKQKS